MSLPRTSSWICDNCWMVIAQAEDGWVEWLDGPRFSDEPQRGRALRIVHHCTASPLEFGCQYKPREEMALAGSIADVPLVELLGPDGLMQLLEMIAEQRLPVEELLEIIKRLHIPGYEHARWYFRAALADGVIEPDVAPGYYRQDALERVLRFYGQNRQEYGETGG